MAYIVCWATSDDSDWEIVNGEDEMQVRCNDLIDDGASTVYVFEEKDEIDNKYL